MNRTFNMFSLYYASKISNIVKERYLYTGDFSIIKSPYLQHMSLKCPCCIHLHMYYIYLQCSHWYRSISHLHHSLGQQIHLDHIDKMFHIYLQCNQWYMSISHLHHSLGQQTHFGHIDKLYHIYLQCSHWHRSISH